jgi:hypothetical protein
LNTPHLWLNAASASGYIEPLDNADHQNNQISDYDTFEVSRSEFGYSVLTYRFGPEASVTLQRKKGGYDGDTEFEVVDEVTFAKNTNDNLPQATAGTGELPANDIQLAVNVGAPEQVHEVQWQLSENEQFEGVVFDVWGNETRRRNLFYDEAARVEGDEYLGYEAIDTQEGADIFGLDLSGLLAMKSVRPGGDDYYRWNKRFSSQNTHVSSYDEFAGQPRPTLSLKPGTTYYWRARVRDTQMNWSSWSNAYSFSLAGTRTPNLLTNGNAEAGDLSGWTQASGLVSAITASNNGGFAAAEGDYYFAGRGFGQGQPGDCCTDSMFQRVDVSSYGQDIDAGKVYLDLSAQMTTWSADDIPTLRIELLDASDQPVAWSQPPERTSSSVKNWETQSLEGFLPANVRNVIVHIGGERKAGNDNDVYFDDLSLSLLY